MRFSRLILGALVIAALLWVIVREQMAGASADAVVNTQIVTVTTPIAGTVTDANLTLGASVSKGDVLASVLDDRPDGVRLDDLVLQRDLAQIRKDVILAQQASVEQEITALASRRETYLTHSLQELSIRLTEARERLRILTEGEQQTDLIGLSLAREEAARLEVVLAAAEKGVFIVGGYNDAPFSEQRTAEARREAARLATDLTAIDAEIEAISRRIDLERIRVGRAAAATLQSPVDGVIWEHLAPAGARVQRGDAVTRVASCENVFVTLSVTQPVFNRLKAGGTATFRFDGSGEVFTGTVARLAGTSAANFYDSLAVAPSERHLERADVLMTLPGLADNPELRCAIGRTGRAFFEVRPLDWLRSLFE